MRESKKSEGGAFKAPPPDRIGLKGFCTLKSIFFLSIFLYNLNLNICKCTLKKKKKNFKTIIFLLFFFSILKIFLKILFTRLKMSYILPLCNMTCLNLVCFGGISFTPETLNFGTFGGVEHPL